MTLATLLILMSQLVIVQNDPILEQVDANIEAVERQISGLSDVKLLVLPEMCFVGYKYRDKKHITPFIEKDKGRSVQWAKDTAKRLKCFVVLGYPRESKGEFYNSAVLVNPSGEIETNYDKHFLYSVDETWAEEGKAFWADTINGLGKISIAICMDINPYKFGDYSKMEYANFLVAEKPDLVIIIMAFLDSEQMSNKSDPSLGLLAYWLDRLKVYLLSEGSARIVFCNRHGKEVDADLAYGGTSCIYSRDGGLHAIAGCGEDAVLSIKF